MISILGCGWLGLPVAEKLISAGFSVLGSTTRAAKLKSLKSVGVEPLLLRIDPGEERGWTPTSDAARFFAASTLIISLPPEAALGEEHFPSQIETVLARMNGVSHVLFVSSTSVYGSKQGRVDEDAMTEPDTDSGRILARVEERLRKAAGDLGFGLTIVRPGGLVGPGRHPGLFLAGRKNLKDPESPVNLIHQLDCAQAIATLAAGEAPRPGEVRVFNLVSNRHPSRADFYTRASRAIGVEPPTFTSASAESATKLVLGERIRKHVDFEFDDILASMGIRA